MFLGIFLGAVIVAFAFSFVDSVRAVGEQAHGEFGSFAYEYVLNSLHTGKPWNGEAVLALPYEDGDGKGFTLMGLDGANYNAMLSDRPLDYRSDEVTEIISDKTYETQMDNMLTAMGGLIDAFMIIGMIVCIASLYATINTIIAENSHNISMLKVLGYENRRINRMVLSSNHLLLLPGIALGTLAAYGIMAWYCAEFVEVESIMIPATLAPKSIVLTAVITAASYCISLLLLRRKVDKADMIAALKDERE